VTSTRRIQGMLVVGALLVIAAWGWSSFERVTVQVPRPGGPEAARDPYLALERMMGAMGRRVTVTHDFLALENLPTDGVLVLAQDPWPGLTAQRSQKLLDWVNRGGHLIATLSPGPELGVLQDAGVHMSAPKPADEAKVKYMPRGLVLRDVDIHVNGRAAPLRASFPALWPGIEVRGAQPIWVVRDGALARIAHIPRGRGAITVISPMNVIAGNNFIGRADNAAVMWLIVGLVHPNGALVVVPSVRTQSPLLWLASVAWAALVSGALLLLVWLWREMVRFGPIVADASPDRRDLAEHLRAMGRAVWRLDGSRGLDHWLETIGRYVLLRAAIRDPRLAQQPALVQRRLLAERLAAQGEKSRGVQPLPAGDAPLKTRAAVRERFVREVRRLQQIETML